MSKKILILGKGFIGHRLQEGFDCPVSGKRILKYSDIDTLIKKYKPKVLINCIGHTGTRNVDDCESAFDKTMKANVFAPLILGEAVVRNKIKLVHISTGCIFHYDYRRQRPITEDRIPDYYDLYYSRTKIYAENVLREMAKRQNILIIRIRIPLDNRPSAKNILTKLLEFKYIHDVPNSATYIPDFIEALKHLIKKDAQGIYNVVNKGALHYSQLLDAYKKVRPDFRYQTVKTKNLKQKRTNLILSTKKLEQSGFTVRPIQEVFEECLCAYLKY